MSNIIGWTKNHKRYCLDCKPDNECEPILVDTERDYIPSCYKCTKLLGDYKD
ncbi:hypothetical protein LCGC14_0541830 [marine sediment metagenome]|uniref:Uncharacterized protein n=1 Tax=marine sediment metagenome TaxID=412755 RepID=A0A0F9UE03_9ZZZZ